MREICILSLAFLFSLWLEICKQISFCFAFFKGFRFAGCRLLQLPLAKDLFYSVLPSLFARSSNRRNVSKTITRFFAPQKTTEILHSSFFILHFSFPGFLIKKEQTMSALFSYLQQFLNLTQCLCHRHVHLDALIAGGDLDHAAVYILGADNSSYGHA